MNTTKNVPEVTMITIPHFSLFINMIWDQVSEKLNNDKGVCSGTRVPDMLDNARLAMKNQDTEK